MKRKFAEYNFRFLILLVAGFFLLAGDLVFAGYGQYNDEETGPGVFLYKHSHFRGSRIFVPAGRNIRNLARNGWNDKISSIELVDGARLRIFEHANFQGASVTIYKDIIDLAQFKRGIPGIWNDQISSIKVLHGRRYGARNDADCVFYKHRDGRGSSLEGRLGRHKRIKSSWNDEVSSVWVARGYRLTLYEHASFTGRKVVLEGTRPGEGTLFNLIDFRFNDQMSSYKLERVRRSRWR